jgi:hypothetical protein
MPTIRDYAFEIKLNALARVVASSKEAAVAAMKQVIAGIDLSVPTIDSLNDNTLVSEVQITSASLDADDGTIFEPFEIDGVPSAEYVERLLQRKK